MSQILDNAAWASILELFAIAILSDHRLRDPELIEFCHEAQDINRRFREDVILPRRSLIEWLKSNQSRIEKRIADEPLDALLSSTCQAIPEHIAAQVCSSVYALCVCDYEFHDEEKDVLKWLMAHWNIDKIDLDLEEFEDA